MGIHVNYLTSDQLQALANAAPDSILCLIGYNTPCPDWVPIGCPFSQVAMQPLTATQYEVWTSTTRVRYDAARRFAVARTTGLMMGLLEPDQLGSQTLPDITREAYVRIFDLIEGAEQSVFRIWNYIPDITGDEDGMERYRHFNAGRAQAFEESQGAPAIPPAASGLGTAGGDMLIYFLAGDGKSIGIENPRQISAYNYPEQYGPRSPNFSRATLVKMMPVSLLFVSGTASIVGHETVHEGNIDAQTRETIENLYATLQEAEKQSFVHSPAHTRVKVYLRDPEHLETVKAIVQKAFPALAGILYLKAEICRKELLVEIEAMFVGK